MSYSHINADVTKRGFSLIEVVLAIGIFLVTVLALVGLLGPTLKSVNEVEKTDQVSSVVNNVNTFLQNSLSIAPGGSRFAAIYNAVNDNDYATMFVFQQYLTDGTGNNPSINLRLVVGFDAGEDVDSSVHVTDFENAAGPIYRVVLSASSVLPLPSGNTTKYRSSGRDGNTKIYSTNADLGSYDLGYFAMEVRIFAEDPGPGFTKDKALEALADVAPVFSYNTAIAR